MSYKIIQGDNRETLKTIPDNSIDAIVTDPPYGIDFLGKSWDANTGALETYQECLRVLKPGGHILAFSAARTYHHLAITLEQAGFEIRDQIMWIYSSGFPKSQDIGRSIQRSLGVKKTRARPDLKETGRGLDNFSHNMDGGSSKESGEQVVCTDPEALQWSGWGTALKPAHEPIALARKPIKLSIAKNAQRWGTGALNIDATRVPIDDQLKEWYNKYPEQKSKTGVHTNYNPELQDKLKEENVQPVDTTEVQGRFPSNVIGEIPDYQKYFYCPKVSRKERHIGFDDVESLGNQLYSIGGYWIVDNQPQPFSGSAPGNQCYVPGVGNIFVHGLKHELDKVNKQNGITNNNTGNNHPTVKPIELMKYLIKLITPPGGTVLDPFNGSGSTGCAAVELGFNYIGCELDQAYVEISNKRIEAWNTKDEPKVNALFLELFEEV